ncbi:hypothetical protein [Streptomyces melanogenes]|uniref:hypothetical protein n=1 Tax=Streptomyces melanogenes TaxID=67326 RepID=UPI0037A85AC0
MAETLGHLHSSSTGQAPSAEPLPAYSETPDDGLPSYTPGPTSSAAAESLPGYTAVPAGGFDPRALTEFQLDELVHRIIGRITRLVRTELRMDRERIGRLRDPRP